jgi:hypothetical protein
MRGVSLVYGRDGYLSGLLITPTPLLVYRLDQIVTKKVYLERNQPRLLSFGNPGLLPRCFFILG